MSGIAIEAPGSNVPAFAAMRAALYPATPLTPVITSGPASQLPIFGVSAFDTQSYGARVAAAVEVGAELIRFDAYWSGFEYATAGTYDFSSTDNLMYSAKGAGLKVMPILEGGNPISPYNSASFDKSPITTAQLTGFGNFCNAFAAHYGMDASFNGLIFAEIGNEVNLNAQQVTSVQYAAMLKVAATNIKSASPQIKVLSSGLATVDDGSQYTTDTFLSALIAAYASSGGDFSLIDGYGAHPYLSYTPYGQPPESTYWKARYAAAIAASGHPKPFYNTEQGSILSAANNDLGLQADFVIRNMANAVVRQDASFVNYSLFDKVGDANPDENAYGLKTANGTMKQTGLAYKAFMGARQGAVTYDYATAGDLCVITFHKPAGDRRVVWNAGNPGYAIQIFRAVDGGPAVAVTRPMVF